MGLLDIPTHKYATLLRSHTKTVHAVAVDSTQGHLCTAAADGSIRIWDATTYQQLLEFLVPGEVCYSCQYHPHLPLVACGFGGGLVRIFSVAETRMVHEHKQHKGAVRQVRPPTHTGSWVSRYSFRVGSAVCVEPVHAMLYKTRVCYS